MEPVGKRGWLLPLVLGAATFALYAVGRPRRVGVDVPAYVANVVDGVWLHDHHLLPRLVGAATWSAIGASWPGTTPEAVGWACVDAATKRARVRIDGAGPIEPGRFLLLKGAGSPGRTPGETPESPARGAGSGSGHSPRTAPAR